MKKSQQWLGGILAVQVLVSASLLFGSAWEGESRGPQPLLDFETGKVDRIVISTSDANTSLEKLGEDWQLQEHALPANSSKVQSLLESLAGLETTWPVAETASSRERFEVSDQTYQRKLQLYQGEALLGEYYFGSSPGFRRTHARRAGEDAVYSLAFNSVDLPAQQSDWLDKSLLALDSPTRIKGPDFLIQRDGESWQLEPVEGEETPALDSSKVENLVSAFDNLRVLRLAEDAQPAEGEEAERFNFEVVDAEGTWHYHFTRAGDTLLAKRGDREQQFAVGSYDFDRIAGIARSDLLLAEEDAAEAEPASSESEVAAEAVSDVSTDN